MPHRPINDIIENQSPLLAGAETSVAEAARLMKERGSSAILVTVEGKLQGIFTERDALFRVIAEGRDPARTPLADVMTPHPQTIGPDRPVGHALHMMYEGGFRHVAVVQDGRPVGLVSARDALGPELREFESELLERQHIREIL